MDLGLNSLLRLAGVSNGILVIFDLSIVIEG
jgi:hypothetical protein